MIALLAVAAGAVAFVSIRAQPQSGTTDGPAAGSTQGTAASSVVAEVNGEPILARDVDRALGTELDRIEQQLYQMRRQQLDALIAERLLAREAARRGVTIEQLVAAEITAQVAPVRDADVEGFYQAMKDRLPPDQPNIKDQIRAYLTQQREAERRKVYVDSLRGSAKVVDRLEPPPVTRHEVNTAGAPVRGPQQAAVTIVEFSDFHCPFCRRVKPTLDQLLQRYPSAVRLVYKDLPLDSLHAQARRASEAGRCANDQGKFWPYHDALLERGPDASQEALTSVAQALGLDVPAFERCLASGAHRDAIQRDIDEATRLGITGTPAFFVNGRLLSGAQPLEAFVKVVEEELAGNVKTR